MLKGHFRISKPITLPPQQALTRFLVKQRGIITHSSVSPHTDKRPGAVATRLNGHEAIYLSPDRDRQAPSNRKTQSLDCSGMRKRTLSTTLLAYSIFLFYRSKTNKIKCTVFDLTFELDADFLGAEILRKKRHHY